MKLSQLTQRARDIIADSSWVSKLPSLLVFTIFLLASTQLGLHFWPDSTLVYGIRIDYLAPTIYLLDVLILTYLITTRSVLKGLEASSPKMSPKRTGLIGHLFPILLTNLIFSGNPLATLNWSFHFLLYFLFISSLSFAKIRSLLLKIIPITMLFQVILGGIQVVIGHTIQGPLYWLGERAISIGTPDAARATIFGRTVLRAYGTFSHPNILAGWLVVSLLIIITLRAQGLTLKDSRHQARKAAQKGQTLLGISIFLAALGIALTQSRTAAISLFGIIIPFYILPRHLKRPRIVEVFTIRGRQLSPHILYFLGLLFAICYLLFAGTLSRSIDTSLTERLHLQGLSLKVTHAFPVFGTGASASISTYPDISPTTRLLQPDHNSFTLLLSWFGIAGILTVLYLFRPHIIHYSLSIIPLLPLLFLDHYLLTSPQGLFILLLYLRVTIFSCSPQN